MRLGALVGAPAAWPPADADEGPGDAEGPRPGERSLYALALRWLRGDRAHRLALETDGQRAARGVRIDHVRGGCMWRMRVAGADAGAQGVPTDSEEFYKRCVRVCESARGLASKADAWIYCIWQVRL
jgi:hypothetical protein